MEILFPAGDLSYIYSAIDCHANAVYGGFKMWNCRNKANNFDILELEHAIKLCHENRIKFYLTLNTMMFDNEIEDVVKILKSMEIKPDAIICADIGLIQVLKQKLDIPLHASTQFGVSNIDCAKVAKQIGFSRIILSRELTLTEINKIISSVNAEVEVFVWGSQCISFSGACYLGSLCNGGTANRGKCITLCRDRYITEKGLGNYLYVPDLNCISYINKMDGVSSLKLEGRRRPVSELKNAVYQIRGLQNCEMLNGYILGEDVENNNLFEKVNSRKKTVFKSSGKPNDPNDVFVKIVNDKFLDYCSGNDEDAYYLYTEIKNDFNFNKYNISFDVEQKNGVVNNVLLLTHKGECFNFYAQENNAVTSIDNISLNDNNLNLYRISYKKEFENQNVVISTQIISEINTFLDNYYSTRNKPNNLESCAIKTLYIETKNSEIAQELSENYSIIFNTVDIDNFMTLNPKDYNNNIIFKLPFFNFKNKNMKEKLKEFKGRKIMATNIFQIFLLEELNIKDVYVDFTINVWNNESVKFLKMHGVKYFCSSPELSLEKNRKIFKNDNAIHLIAGFPTCVYTRNCFKNSIGCQSCNKAIKNIKNYDRNIDFNINCYGDHRELTYKLPILNSVGEQGNNEAFRYITGNETIDVIKKNIGLFSTNNYFINAKKDSFWKNSFSNNLMEDM